MSEAGLEAAVRRYFGDPAEVAEYAAIAAQGLTRFEAALIGLAFAPGQRVLDVGCGGGREAIPMARHGLRVVAMDVVPAMVQATALYAIAQDVRLATAAGSVTALPFREGAFDGVSMLGQIIAHVPSRLSRLAALSSAWRVLRPGGALVMTTHNRRCHVKFRLYFAWVNRWRRLVRRFGGQPALGDHDRWSGRIGDAASRQPLFFHMYDLDEAVADLRAAKFEVLDARARAEFEAGRDDAALRARDYLLGFIARRP